jgi:two-component system NtrC family sensor kinase
MPGWAELDATPGLEAADDLSQSVDKALLERPGFGIRAHLALVFLLFFGVSAGITLATWVILSHLENRLQFLESADDFNREVLQARRYEKNHFLYGAHLVRYQDLIVRLDALETAKDPGDVSRQAIEDKLRVEGAALVKSGRDLADRERRTVRTLLRVTRAVPLAFLFMVLAVAVYGADFLSRHLIRRLNRLMELTRRIGKGDLSPIVPVRKFRDEFTNLVVALNRMMRELEHRHAAMVQSQKLRAVGRLTAGVAHELNNPINNIMLTAAALQEDFSTLSEAERLELVNDLIEQADRSRRIVRNLLDFAREGEMRLEPVDLAEIVRGAVALVGNQLKLSGVKVVWDLPADLPFVSGDRQHLSQVFVNLVLNAVDAMPEGGNLTIAGESDGFFVVVSVRDRGTGIPAQLLPLIFDPFFTSKPMGQGTGLGLSVSLGIARQHGGDIRVHSREGEGATFSVILPALEHGAGEEGVPAAHY